MKNTLMVLSIWLFLIVSAFASDNNDLREVINLFKNKNITEGMSYINVIIKLEPNNANAYLIRAVGYYESLGMYDKAIPAFNKQVQ